ncbi:MAG: hypothetical protein V1494_03060 [Candidatus Diapherotrites archaeon]
MAENIAGLVFASIFEFLKGSFINSIPLFIIVLFGMWLKEKLKRKYRLSWVKSVFAATFIICLALIAFANLQPWFFALGEQTAGTAPPVISETILDSVFFAAATLVLFFLKALVVSLVLLPLEFVGAFVSEAIEKKFKWHSLARLYISVFVMTAIASALILFAFPWILTGIIYLVFFTF